MRIIVRRAKEGADFDLSCSSIGAGLKHFIISDIDAYVRNSGCIGSLQKDKVAFTKIFFVYRRSQLTEHFGRMGKVESVLIKGILDKSEQSKAT